MLSLKPCRGLCGAGFKLPHIQQSTFIMLLLHPSSSPMSMVIITWVMLRCRWSMALTVTLDLTLTLSPAFDRVQACTRMYVGGFMDACCTADGAG